jgi:hypothetical protein
MFGLKEKKEWPSENDNRTCENCIHAALVVHLRRDRNTDELSGVNRLQCRRLPTMAGFGVEDHHQWPYVREEDWCQEHEEPENTYRWEPRRAVYNLGSGLWPREDG